MASIYPTVNLPALNAPLTAPATKKLKVAPYFDFELGDFILDGAKRPVIADARETFAQWCYKVCLTERGTKLAYSDKIGVEMSRAMKHSNDAAVRSQVRKTITEALMVNPNTEYVKDFDFRQDGDALEVSFSVKARNYPEVHSLKLRYGEVSS